MSVLAPVKLPEDLKSEIRSLANDLELKVAAFPGQEAPELGSIEPVRLAPQVQIKSLHRTTEAGEKLRIQPVCATRSPWDERYSQPWLEEDDGRRERKLQEEQADRERWYGDRLKERENLPIYQAKERVLAAIRQNRVTLVAADTGSGKSTQVSQYILDEAIAQGCGRHLHVVCTQPRRLAAVSLASRVAWERGERSDGAGSTGHVVRWEEKPPRPWGSIVFCTVGSLLPRLSRLGASHIIVDEAHTRDIHTDLLLTVLLELLRCSRDLKVIVMSATLDVVKWQGHFKDFACDLVRAGGRPYYVQQYFLEDIVQELRWQPDASQSEVQGVWSDVDCNRGFVDPEGKYSQATLLTVRSIPESIVEFRLISSVLKWVDGWGIPGGVLVFLPGWHEIASCMSRLQRDPALRNWDFVPLHSSLTPNEQYKAFQPSSNGRKAILSTDIAETSITIPDIICVVDSGLARVKKHTNLEVVWASQANLLQRAGRAGRVQHGRCVHLFTRSRFSLLEPEPTPEMRRVPLDETLLNVCELGLDYCKSGSIPDEHLEEYGACAYVMNFLKQAPDPPLFKDVWNAFKELQHVGALDRSGFLTHLGALLVRLPMSSGLGTAFYFASLLGYPEAASQVAAALDGRDPFSRRQNEESSAALRFAEGSDGKKWSDVFAMAKALGDFEWADPQSNYAARFCRQMGLIHPVMQQLSSAMQQLKRVSWDLSKACLPWDKWDDQQDCEGEEKSQVFPEDKLEESWPIMQAMLTLAYGWNIGMSEGGRRVNAGWTKAARWAKTSVLVDDDPPCPFVSYVELTNSGGRILRGGTMVTPQQLILCGGRGGPFWQNDTVILENWLEIEADYESAALLAALRSCNSLVLQKAAELSLQEFKGQWIDWKSRQGLLDLIQKWRRCVIQVACLPLPDKISVWDMDYSRVSPRTPTAAMVSTAPEMVPRVPQELLPCSSIAPAPYPVAPCFPCVAPSPVPSVVGSTTRWNQAHPQCAQATQMIQPYQGHQPMEMVYHQVISSTPQVHHPLVSSPQPVPVPVSSDPSVSWSAVSRTERPHTRWSAQGSETKQAGAASHSMLVANEMPRTSMVASHEMEHHNGMMHQRTDTASSWRVDRFQQLQPHLPRLEDVATPPQAMVAIGNASASCQGDTGSSWWT